MTTLLWFIATILASPILLLLCMVRMRLRAQKVLIITLGKLGDTVCTTGMYRAIKESDPDAVIHVLCTRGSATVLKGNPFIDQIHVLEGETNRWSLLAALRAQRFDTVINSMPNAFGSMIGLWALAPHRINGMSSLHGMLVKILSIFQTANIRYGIHMNTYAHYMKLVEAAGFRPIPYHLDFFYSQEAKAHVDTLLKKNNLTKKKYVVLNVTAGNSVKEWPEEKFAQLAQYCIDTLKLPVVLSTADKDSASRIEKITVRGAQVVNAAGLTLEQCGALYASAAAFVSVDTGPLYIAYACGAPVVVMVGPVDPVEQIPPAGPRAAHVMPPAGCTPWVFIAATPRTGTPDQLRAARDTTVESVMAGLKHVLA